MTLTGAERVLFDFIQQQAELEQSFDREGTTAWVHRSVYALLLAHGQWCTPAVLPPGVDPLRERYCYRNAQRTELAHPALIYTEGWALAATATAPIPLPHAWCTTVDGDVVDPTWAGLGGGIAYFGIPLADPAPPRRRRPRCAGRSRDSPSAAAQRAVPWGSGRRGWQAWECACLSSTNGQSGPSPRHVRTETMATPILTQRGSFAAVLLQLAGRRRRAILTLAADAGHGRDVDLARRHPVRESPSWPRPAVASSGFGTSGRARRGSVGFADGL
ncbi:hypothetical protein ATKI12_5592 [Kitasatospora sp. Ki12]